MELAGENSKSLPREKPGARQASALETLPRETLRAGRADRHGTRTPTAKTYLVTRKIRTMYPRQKHTSEPNPRVSLTVKVHFEW
jgi:hypothetical protein